MALLHPKSSKKKGNVKVQQVLCVPGNCSVFSWHRKEPRLVPQGEPERGSGIIIISAINIDAWIPHLSTHLDDLIMGSLQAWLV